MPSHGKIIVIKRSGADGTSFPLTAKTCLFGRKADCDIRIQLPHVSKEHCKVEVKENGEVLVTNLSSVNPTQLNGNALKQPVRLKHGDIITIIDRSFRFESPQSPQGRRRSAGLESENFKLFTSDQSEDKNETVRIESITSKVQRKSEGSGITRTTHTRRSLQTSSETSKNHCPFGELYEILKSSVKSGKKENGQMPIRESSSSPKNVTVKRNFQADAFFQSPATSRRDPRSRQSSDSATVRSKDTKVGPRAASADRVRGQSKSPSSGPRNSLTKQKQGSAVEVNSPVISDKSAQISLTHEEAEHVQTFRRRSGKPASGSQEQAASVVTPEKPSPRRSRSAEEIQAVGPVPSPAGSNRRNRSQSVPHSTAMENQENSPLPIQSPKGRRSTAKDQTKGTPTKPAKIEEKAKEPVQVLATKSPRKRRSDELGLNEPLFKRKRVSFGGHLSPELFDKRLPPNSPLKKGATPARRSLSLNSPRTVIRKSFGLKQTAIKEVLERSAAQHVSSPLVTSRTPTKRASASGPAQSPLTEHASTAVREVSVLSPKRRSSAGNKSSRQSLLPVAITPVKPSPNKRSPSHTPLRTSPSTRSPVIAPSKTPVKRGPVKSETTASAKRSPVPKLPDSAKKSPVKSLPSTPVGKPSVTVSTTPAKRSPSTRSPIPVKKSLLTYEATTPAKLSTPVKRSPGRPPATTPAKLSTPGKRSPGKSTSPTPAKKSPAKLSTPGKRSPGRSPAKKSPAKLSTPGKRSPGKSTSPTPAKKSPAKLSTPGKRSPGRPPSTTPAKKSPARLSTTPAKISAVAKSPASAKKSPVSSAAKRSPSTPYTKGRFSVSHVDTPPQVVERVLASQTPKQPRKSLTSKKTPHRRSRKLDAFKIIRARRRSGASEANLFVAKSWADVVKIGVAKPQKKINKSSQKPVATKKKLKPKTPARRLKDLSSTGHAESPATILVGRAHTRTLNLTGYVPKVVRNEAVKLNPAHNESFTGMAELFSTPVTAKQCRSSRFDGSKAGTPKSTVEISVMQTPEEAGEMVVSPLNSPATTQRNQYGSDAVSRLLDGSVSQEISEGKSAMTKNAEKEASKFSKDSRKSVGLTGVKRIMKTPKQKGKPITDPHALRKLLKTPKETETTQTYTRRSAKLDVLGIAQLMKTPRQRGEPVEDLVGIKRVMKTPRQKGEPVEDFAGLRRIMRTPKERGQPVEDMVGIKRLMRSPKVRGQPVEDIDLSHLMRTPVDNTQSVENTRPIEEIFGIKNLVKTPKKSAAEQALTIDPKNASEVLKSLGASSNTPVKRGRPSKRLSLPAETASTVNEVQKTMAVAESEIAQESGVHSISEVIKSAHKKKGRPSKNIPASEMPKESAAIPEVSSPSRRGRTAPELPQESQVSDVTSPSHRGRPRSTVLSPVADHITLQADEGNISQAQTVSVTDEVTTPSCRGRPRSTAPTPKESVPEVISPSRRGRSTATVVEKSLPASATPKEYVPEVTSPSRRGRSTATVVEKSLPASAEAITSPRGGGRHSTSLKAAEESKPASQEITSPTRRGRPSKTTTVEKDLASALEITSPTRSGRPSTTSEAKEMLLDSSDKIISPKRRGRPSSAETPSESVPTEALTSPSRRGRISTTAEATKESAKTADVASPSRRGKPQSTPEEMKESLAVSDAKVVSPSRRGRSVKAAKEYVSVAHEMTSPTRRGKLQITETLPKVLEPATVGKVKNTRGRLLRTKDVSKDSSSVATVTSQTLRGRSRDPVEVLKDSAPVAKAKSSVDALEEPVSEVTSPRGRPKASAELPKESVVVTEQASTTHRGRAKKSANVPEKDTDVSQTRGGRAKAKTDLPDEPIPATSGDQKSTRRGRPKAAAVVKEPVLEESEVTSTRRGKTKVAEEPVPAASDVRERSPTRRGRPKTTDITLPVAVTSPTRQGRTKLSEQPKEPIATTSDVTSPTRRGRPKTSDIAKEPVAAASAVTSPTRRGRPKTTDIPKEPVPAVDDVTSPTRKGRSKTVEEPKVPISAASDVNLPTRRGRPKTTDKPVSDSEAVLPACGERLRNTEAPKESLPVSVEVTSSKRSGRPARSTEKKTDSSSEVLDDAKQGVAKMGRRAVHRQAAKNPKQKVDELPQEAEMSQPEESNTTAVQPPAPSRRGRGRKAAQNESPATAEDVADPNPEEPKLEVRRRGQSKSKSSDEPSKEAVEVPNHAKSPAAKRPSRNPKETQPGPSVVEPTKNVRGRQSRTAQKDNSAETTISEATETTDLPPKRTPTKGRSRTKDTSDMSAEQESTASAPVSKQRGRRKKQSTEETIQVQAEPTETSRATRGKRGLPDNESPQPATEIKGKRTTRGKDSGEQIVEEKSSKAKSVQWHPLLTTDGIAKRTDEVEETTTEAPARGGRSKGRTKPCPSEPIPAKKSCREDPEPPTISEANTASSNADVSVSKGRRGRRAAISQQQLEPDSSSDVQSSSVEIAKSSGKQALHPARGRRMAASSKALDSENNEVDAVEVSSSRGKRGNAPSETTNQSPAKPKNQRKGVLVKESSSEAEGETTRSAKGVKRRNLSDTHISDNATANNADTENIPTVRGKRTARNTKAEKNTEESLVEKQIVSSLAKRRKTEVATSATIARGRSKETSKPKTVKSPVATKVRASTRSRK